MKSKLLKILLSFIIAFFLFPSISLSSQVLNYPLFQVVDNDGNSLSGGLVYFYIPGTTTPKTAYTDIDLSVAAANPTELNSRGEALIYLNGNYKINVTTKLDEEGNPGTQIPGFPVDNFSGSGEGSGKYSANYNSADQGVDDNSNSVKDLVDQIGAKSATIILKHWPELGNTTTYTFSTDTTIPLNIVLEVENGARISIGSEAELTIDGPFEAGLYQVFSGDGSVALVFGHIKELYPQWWGMVGDGLTASAASNTAALQAAIVCAETSNRVRKVFIPSGTYYVNPDVLTISNELRLVGANKASVSLVLTGSAGKLLSISDDSNRTNQIHIEDIGFNGNVGYAQYGIYVNYSNNLQIKRCNFSNLKFGIWAVGDNGFKAHITDCKLDGGTIAGSIGIFLTGDAGNATLIESSIITNYASNGVVATGQALTIKSTIFEDVRTGSAVRIEGTTGVLGPVNIEGCYFEDNFLDFEHNRSGTRHEIHLKIDGSYFVSGDFGGHAGYHINSLPEYAVITNNVFKNKTYVVNSISSSKRVIAYNNQFDDATRFSNGSIDSSVMVYSILNEGTYLNTRNVLGNVAGWRKFTILYSDFTESVNGTAQGIGGFTFPAGTIIHNAIVYVTTAFAGGGVTTLTCHVADNGTTNEVYTSAHDVLGAGNDVYVSEGETGDKGSRLYDGTTRRSSFFKSASGSMTAYFTPDGAHALTDLTAGECDIWIQYSVLQ